MAEKIELDPFLPEEQTKGYEIPQPIGEQQFYTPAELREDVNAERVEIITGDTYKDRSTVMVVPTRGRIHWAAVASWNNLMRPANQRTSFLFSVGHEVGIAYNSVIEYAINDPILRQWPYILTMEDDNLPPRDALMRLTDAMEQHPEYVAIASLYFSKGDQRFPMAFGDPERYAITGDLDFLPREDAMSGHEIIEVNGLAMGFTLWRTEIFIDMPRPWFRTEQSFDPRVGVKLMTQDLYFCKALREKGHRLAVHCGVRCGHLDTRTGVVS